MIKDKEGTAKPLAIIIKDTGECTSHVVCSLCKMITTPFEEGKCPFCGEFDRLYPQKSCDTCGAVCEVWSDVFEQKVINLHIEKV